MKLFLARLAAGAALAFVCSAHLAAAPAGPTALLDAATIKRIDAVFAPWDNTRSPGAVVAISRHGQVVFARGYGMSDLQHDILLTPDSIFHVASISKQFTTAAVQLLAEDGKLAWTDDIRRHVPELPDYGHPITLAHLAHHTSGLRDQWMLLRLAGWREDDLITEADVLHLATRQKALNFAPGEEYVYCNTGYTLLAVVVQRVSGQSLREFAAARIFAPLGMTATHFHSDHTEIVRGRTSAYQPRTGRGYRISIPVFDTYGATSLFTTVGDLLKWQQNFVAPRIGGPAFAATLLASGKLNRGAATGYGLGVRSGRVRNVLETGHSGADAGYRTDVVQFPEHGLAIAVFCNLSSLRPSDLSRQVAQVLLGDAFAPLPPEVPLPAAELQRAVGAYLHAPTDQLVRLSLRDGKLTSSADGDPWVPIGEGRFRVGTSDTQVAIPALATLPRDGASAPPASELHLLSPTLGTTVLTRIAPHQPSRDELAALAGEFASDELLGARFRIAANRSDALEFHPPRGEAFTLTPVAKDLFTGRLGLVRFVRDAAGEVTGLTLSSTRVRRLPLQKLAASPGASVLPSP
jgi:CubicO group peptidase (beta-lactamase class C family)